MLPRIVRRTTLLARNSFFQRKSIRRFSSANQEHTRYRSLEIMGISIMSTLIGFYANESRHREMNKQAKDNLTTDRKNVEVIDFNALTASMLIECLKENRKNAEKQNAEPKTPSMS